MSMLLRLYSRLRTRALLELDGFLWSRTLAPLRAESRPAATKTILFCDLFTMAATAKVEALMAGLLRLKGYRCVVLLDGPYAPIADAFRAAVPDAEFAYLSDMSEATRRAGAEDAERVFKSYASLQDLVAYETDGYRIGRNVQSLVLRRLRKGRLDDNEPEHVRLTKETLAQSLAVKRFSEDLLDRVKPDKAVFIERGYTPAGEVFDGCVVRGVDVIQWCGAPKSDSLLFRRYNLQTRSEHPLKLSDALWDALLATPFTDAQSSAIAREIENIYSSGMWYNRQNLQDGKVIVAADQVRAKLGLKPGRKMAVIFAHILYDATFFYGDSLYEDYEQWLVETVRGAIANTNIDWIVKVHPVNVWRSKLDGAEMEQLESLSLRKAFGDLPDNVKILGADTDINTYSLFQVMDYGLTVRGTIGMELPCFGIPIVTAGTGRYSGRGFTIDPQTREAYQETLGKLHEVPPLDQDTIRKARLHYHGAMNLRPVPMRSYVLDFHANTFGLPALSQNVRVNQRADAKLLEADDLGRLITWIDTGTSQELIATDIG